MQTEPRVSCDDIPVDEAVRDLAAEHIDGLEAISDRLNGCHMTIAQPHGHAAHHDVARRPTFWRHTPMTPATAVTASPVSIPALAASGAPIDLPGQLTLPEAVHGLVLFAHGSGSSRLSPRNQFVASVLHEAWIGTLLFDLLTEQESLDRVNVFDIGLLADRLAAAIRFVAGRQQTAMLPLGLFGASTGAAAALVASTQEPRVKAVVSRGGRPDMAGKALPRVVAATLFIVGGEDEEVLALNRLAFDALTADKQLAVVKGATHLFEEPGTLAEAARLAAEWFARHLRTPS